MILTRKHMLDFLNSRLSSIRCIGFVLILWTQCLKIRLETWTWLLWKFYKQSIWKVKEITVCQEYCSVMVPILWIIIQGSILFSEPRGFISIPMKMFIIKVIYFLAFVSYLGLTQVQHHSCFLAFVSYLGPTQVQHHSCFLPRPDTGTAPLMFLT